MSQTKKVVDRGNKSRSEIDGDRLPNRLRIGEARDLLSVKNLDPNRYYRWVNDDNDGQNIETMKLRGYRIETSKTLKVGDPNEGEAVGDGSVHRKYVGVGKDGKALHAFLMSIDNEWHQEDQADLAAEVDEQERAILYPNLEDEAPEHRVADYVVTDSSGKRSHGVVKGSARARLRDNG